VIDLAASSNGPQFYALVGTTKVRAVELLAPGAPRAQKSIPVDNRAVAIAPLPDGSGIWVLLSTGTVQEVSAATNHVVTSFATGEQAAALALSPDGKILYVLRAVQELSIAPHVGSNVAVVDLATEQVTHVLPAPAHCVDISISADGRTLYDAVGTSKVGNIQAFALAG
jgi:DNA-binding beta-propeller fold protein YncE